MSDGYPTEERDRLSHKLTPIFGEDSANTATMLISALGRDFGLPIKEKDRAHYLDAMQRLPRGGKVKPRLEHVPHETENGDSYWVAVFTVAADPTHYRSSKHFSTEAEARDYASSFLERLAQSQR